jgi:hypothetical protein
MKMGQGTRFKVLGKRQKKTIIRSSLAPCALRRAPSSFPVNPVETGFVVYSLRLPRRFTRPPKADKPLAGEQGEALRGVPALYEAASSLAGFSNGAHDDPKRAAVLSLICGNQP